MLFDDAVANAESQACSLPYRLGGVKRIEHTVRALDGRAVIGELDAQTIAIPPCESRFSTAGGFSTASTALFKILRNTCCNWWKSPPVAGRSGSNSPANFNIRGLHVVFAQNQRVFDDLVEVDGYAFRPVLAREAQQALDDVVRALRLLVELLDIVGAAGAREFLRLQKLAVAENRGQRVIEFVGHAGDNCPTAAIFSLCSSCSCVCRRLS